MIAPDLESIKRTRPLDYHDEAHLKTRKMYARNAQMDRFVSTFETVICCAVWVAVVGVIAWALWVWLSVKPVVVS